MIVARDKIYDYISQIAVGDYSIGMHGIEMYKLPEGHTVETAAQSIMEIGLRNRRTINGTIKFFGRIDLVDDEQKVRTGLDEYNYGGEELMLVAIPTRFRNKEGESLFLGSPNLDNKFKREKDTTGYEETTLLDKIVQDHEYVDGEYKGELLAPEFILGGCRVVDEEHVDITINPNHICFNDGLITDETYKRVEKRFEEKTSYLKEAAQLFRKIKLTEEEKQAIDKTIELLGVIDEVYNIDSSQIMESYTQLKEESDKPKRNITKIEDLPIDFCEINTKTNQK